MEQNHQRSSYAPARLPSSCLHEAVGNKPTEFDVCITRRKKKSLLGSHSQDQKLQAGISVSRQRIGIPPKGTKKLPGQ
eukprot:scaffold390196_cov45-Prasinocladus_malaysianus.AAC.1